MKNRQSWPSWLLTAVALLGLMGLAYGQGEALSEAAPGPLDPSAAQAVDAPVLSEPAGVMVPVVITDDGRRGDELLEARQLIIALTAERTRSIGVDLLDERGRVVRSCALEVRAGRRALVVDVSALAKGRYAARITGGDATTVVRFTR